MFKFLIILFLVIFLFGRLFKFLFKYAIIGVAHKNAVENFERNNKNQSYNKESSGSVKKSGKGGDYIDYEVIE